MEFIKIDGKLWLVLSKKTIKYMKEKLNASKFRTG